MARILITTDGSEFAEHAAREGVRLFGTSGHEYVVLSVAPGALATGTAVVTPTAEVALSPDAWEQIEEASKEAAHEFADQAAAIVTGAGGAQPRLIVVPGDPADIICRAAADAHADVVVVGSRGAGLLTRLVTGSVSNHVVHHVPCPVLVVRETPEASDEKSAG